MEDWHNHTNVARHQIVIIHQTLDVVLHYITAHRILKTFIASGMVMVKQRGSTQLGMQWYRRGYNITNIKAGSSFVSFNHVYSSVIWERIIEHMRNIVLERQLSLVYQFLHNIFQSVTSFHIVAQSALMKIAPEVRTEPRR